MSKKILSKSTKKNFGRRKEKTQVYVRVKPLGAGGGGGEIEAKKKGCKSSMTFTEKTISCGEKDFNYPYRVLGPECGQNKTYQSVAGDLVSMFLGGFDVNIMGYGQTGSGKTHTLYGPPNLLTKYFALRKKLSEDDHPHENKEEEEEEEGEGENDSQIIHPENERLKEYEKDLGVFPRAAMDILKEFWKKKKNGVKCSLTATMVEIHLLEIFDVLNSKRSIGFEKNDCMIRGEHEWDVESEKDMFKLISYSENRATSATLMNDTSSRSHLVVCLIYCEKNDLTGKVRTSKFTVIDLGGSERAHEAHGQNVQLKNDMSALEGLMINISLFILLWCVEKYSKRKKAVSRNREKRIKDFVLSLSTYWFGLQLPCLIHGSFLGISLTRIFINVSQAPRNTFQSNYALEFGRKASHLTMRPMKNPLLDYKKLVAGVRRKLKENQVALRRLKEGNNQKYKMKRSNEVVLLKNQLRRLIKVK